MSSGFINLGGLTISSWRSPVATASLLPINGNNSGDAIVTQDTDKIYIWNGSAWVIGGGGGGVTSLNSITGAINIVGGSNITVTPSTGTITISETTSGANTALSNLTSTAVNVDLNPGTSGINLGDYGSGWNALFLGGISGGSIWGNSGGNLTLHDYTNIDFSSIPILNVSLGGNMNASGYSIHTLLDPTSAQDAATKNYVDTTTVSSSSLGVANGVATLDSGGHIPLSQLPSTLVEYRGTWNASTNTPTLTNGTGTSGFFYIVSTAGTTNFGAGNITFNVGDWVLYNGTIWERAVQSNVVQSVNGQTGVVIVNAINQLTGDVITSAASGSQSEVTSLIATTNSTLTTLSALSLPGSQITGTVAIANGGTNATTAAAAFNNLSPMTTTGDIIYEASAGVAARLAIGAQGRVLAAGASGLPLWTATLRDASSVASVNFQSRTLVDTTGTAIQLSWSTTGVAINTGLALNGTTSGAVTQTASSTTTPYTIIWPAAQGGTSTVLQNNGSGTLSWATPTTGTVTSVSVVTANGLSGTVATSTSTPAITLAPTFTGITYSTGTAFQAAIASNFPTLNQNTTGNATTATNIASGADGSIPYQTAANTTTMLAIGSTGQILTVTGGLPAWAAAPATGVTSVSVVTANNVTGSVATSTTTPAITLSPTSSTPAVSSFSSWDANKNLSANNLIDGYATTVTSATPVVLTVASAAQQFFTGSTAQTVTLPVTSTLVLGQSFIIQNNSTASLTVQSSGANTVIVLAANTAAVITTILTTGTTAASWNATLMGSGGAVVPTVQKFLSGSGTYTTPSNVIYIEVKMVGGGAGGNGGGSGSTNGGGGGNTTFGASLLTANGGFAGSTYTGGIGGSASVTTSSTVLQVEALTGGSGSNESVGSGSGPNGGLGGTTSFGGAGTGGIGSSVSSGTAGIANTGAGGGGGGGPASGSYGGGGGGAGGYVNAIIVSPSTTYTYAVGAAGTAGAAGSGTAGGAGGSGQIVVTEYYANGAVGTATSITGSVNSSQVLGTTAGGNAPTGYIGEFISANPGSGVAVGSTTAFVTITSISLTAGDWDVEGVASLVTGSTTAGTVFSGGISLNATSEDSQANGGVFDSFNTLVASSTYLSPTGKRRINVSNTTTVYLVGAVTYTVSGSATWGTNSFIGARRVR